MIWTIHKGTRGDSETNGCCDVWELPGSLILAEVQEEASTSGHQQEALCPQKAAVVYKGEIKCIAGIAPISHAQML